MTWMSSPQNAMNLLAACARPMGGRGQFRSEKPEPKLLDTQMAFDARGCHAQLQQTAGRQTQGLRRIANVDPTSIAGLGAQIAQLLLIETESSIDPSLNHGVAGLTDSFAVYYLYNRLSPNLDAPQIRALVQSASNSMSDSLEKSLNHLCTMVFGDSVLTAGKTATGNREQLYANLKALVENKPAALPEKFFDGVRHKTVQKFSPGVSASCKRARSCKKSTINSIASCARKQRASSRSDYRRRIVKITYRSAAK